MEIRGHRKGAVSRARRGGGAFATCLGLLVAMVGSGTVALTQWHHASPVTIRATAAAMVAPQAPTKTGRTSSTSLAATGLKLTMTTSQFTATPDRSSPAVAAQRRRPPVTTTTTTATTVPPATPATPTASPTPAPSTSYPTGIPDATEPSGLAPPGTGALAGYALTYVSDFSGASLPAGWDAYSGVPGSDPGAQFGSAHSVVSGGMLQLNASQDPAYNDEWVTGGVCQCGYSQTYGAYFVRSRVTGPGPTGVELLWPLANTWPPEVDFNETGGGTTSTSATLHFGSTNSQDQQTLTIDMTQWHTWGVIWTPSSITYTVDGRAWATVAVSSEIPNQAMTLDLQQQTWCGSGWACPTSNQSMDVDWVAEYAPQ